MARRRKMAEESNLEETSEGILEDILDSVIETATESLLDTVVETAIEAVTEGILDVVEGDDPVSASHSAKRKQPRLKVGKEEKKRRKNYLKFAR